MGAEALNHERLVICGDGDSPLNAEHRTSTCQIPTYAVQHPWKMNT